jgi:serine/threonine-protein kinase
MPGSENRPPPALDDRSGDSAGARSIGGYRLLRRIGEGAMSGVYLGYDPRRLRQVAVKLLAEHLASDKQFVNRFYREARMSRALTHPSIVHGFAHGFDPTAHKHYLILEYVDGPNALALLHRLGRLSVGAVVRMGIEIGRALEYLHAQGYIHRDVKPDNILLGPAGTAKLADLGLAKRASGDAELTTTTQGVGTPHYMPYEQAVNGDLVDGRSDLFALGATLYHLLTGHVPFQGETHEELIREKAQNAYRPARELRPDVPPALDAILTRTLLCDPRARFQSATELVEALRATGLVTKRKSWGEGAGPRPATGDRSASPDVPTAQTRADLVKMAANRQTAKTGEVPGYTHRRFWSRVTGWQAVIVTLVAATAGILSVAGVRAAVRWRHPVEVVRPVSSQTGPDAKLPGVTTPAQSQYNSDCK